MELETETVNGKEYVLGTNLAKAHGLSRTAALMAVRGGRLTGEVVLGRLLIPLEDALAWKPSTHGGSRRKRKDPSPD